MKPIERITTWHPEIFARECFAEFPIAEEICRWRDWPSLQELNDLCQSSLNRIDMIGFCEAKPKPSRRPKGPRGFEDFYEPSIYLNRKIPLRSHDYHDLMNALVWQRFPRAKSTLNRLHYEIFTTLYTEPIFELRNRTPLQDHLTLIDEGAKIFHGASTLFFGHGALECFCFQEQDFGFFEINLEGEDDVDLLLAEWLEQTKSA